MQTQNITKTLDRLDGEVEANRDSSQRDGIEAVSVIDLIYLRRSSKTTLKHCLLAVKADRDDSPCDGLEVMSNNLLSSQTPLVLKQRESLKRHRRWGINNY